MHRQCPQMESKTGGETPVTPEDASSDVVRLVLFASILIAAATLITLLALGAGARSSFTVFDIPDLQGLQMKNWVTGRGFGFDRALLTGGDNPIWMRWARMPLPIWTIAGLRIVFGSGMIAVNVAKSVLWSLPLILSLALIQRDCRTFYADIGVGHHYKSESDFDAGQEKEALQYMKTHPRATIIAMGRKIGVLLFSLKKVGPGTIRSPMVEWTERASRVIAQLVLPPSL
jgi:hypothetical protein